MHPALIHPSRRDYFINETDATRRDNRRVLDRPLLPPSIPRHSARGTEIPSRAHPRRRNPRTNAGPKIRALCGGNSQETRSRDSPRARPRVISRAYPHFPLVSLPSNASFFIHPAFDRALLPFPLRRFRPSSAPQRPASSSTSRLRLFTPPPPPSVVRSRTANVSA